MYIEKKLIYISKNIRGLNAIILNFKESKYNSSFKLAQGILDKRNMNRS